MHCSIALPGTDGQGHVSIATEHETPPTPIALVDRGLLTAELVAGIWTAAAAGGTVVFVGPVDAEPATVLGAHAPFIPATERPVAIGPGASQVDLPHETALTLPQEGNDADAAWATRIERDALHPDVAVVSGLNSASGLERLGTVLASGRQVFAAGRITTRTLFGTLLARAGIGHQIRAGVDLVVELPPQGTEEVATGWLPVEPDGNMPAAEHQGTGEPELRVGWERLFDPEPGTDRPSLSNQFVDGLRGTPAAPGLPVESTFARRKQYVEYLVSEGATDRGSLMGFLTDLRTDETATIERIRDRNGQ